jgi:hypothetical protein
MSYPKPKITFGIIILNGEPFTRYCIRSLYPHAHEIIIAEGACEGARSVATPDGHSQDDTLEILREIKRLEDAENKITIITAEDEGHPDGFWPGEKHEQSRAYAKRATGNYLWQVDIDEFYKEEDVVTIRNILESNPDITAVSFKQIQFWGGFDYIVDGWYLRRGMEEFHRLFKWGAEFQYITHRPPTVLNVQGTDTRKLRWLNANQTKKMGIFLYHYSFVFPKQIDEKVEYYRNADWAELDHTNWWKDEVYYKFKYPYKAFINTYSPGWIERIEVNHPHQIQKLIEDIKTGLLNIKIRPTDDLRAITGSFKYRFTVRLLKMANPVDYYISVYIKSAKRKINKFFKI